MSMNTVATQARQAIEQNLRRLSARRLRFVADIVQYLATQEEDEATQELCDIPGFLTSFEHGCQDAAAGRLTPIDKLQRKY